MRGILYFVSSLTNVNADDEREVLDVRDDQDLQSELDEITRKIRALRGARAAITYDLEQNLKEQDRLRRHLNAGHGPHNERGD